jgi:hypothetical protein
MIEHHRKIIAFLRSVGAEEPHMAPPRGRGGHPRVVWLWQGREFYHAVSASPGDTIWSTDKAIADIRRKIGLVSHTKRIGQRRRARRTPVTAEVPRLLMAAPCLADWHASLSEHPASTASLPARLDHAWIAWWRKLMRDVGGESRL